MLHDPDPYAFALVADAAAAAEADKAIDGGNFGSIFPALVSKSKGRENLLYKGFFTGEFAAWDPKRFLSFDEEQKEDQLQAQARQQHLLEQEEKESVSVVLKRLNSSSSSFGAGSGAGGGIHDLVREASNLYKVQGPRNIVSLYTTINSHGNKTCLVMEKVDGGNLKNFLRHGSIEPRSSSALWWKTKMEIFREVVLGVMHCHSHGVYHGDLKGDNIVMDKFLVPKLVDFGLSFRNLDLNYVKSLACSWFWAAPEIVDSSRSIDPEVEENPYPSDVYSLGMILVEMSLDGRVPDELSGSYHDFKFMDGPVQPFLIEEDEDEELKNILLKLEQLVDECCKADRTERISLEECLAKVDEAYRELCDHLARSSTSIVLDVGSSLGCWNETIVKLRELYPGVPDCVFCQLDKNMMLNPQGELLVHAFCKVDCSEGIQFLTEQQHPSWSFQPSEDVPFMLLLAVRSGSLSVLKFLSEKWRHIATEQWVLVHEACNLERPDLFRFLVFDLDLPCDTWGRERETLMPVHKLARQGKTEMIEVLLERHPELIDAFVDPYKCRTALYYAAKRDDMNMVGFLVGKGGGVYVPKGKVGRSIDVLLATACKKGCLNVVVGLLDGGFRLGLDSIAGIRLDDFRYRFQALKKYVDGCKDDGAGVDLRRRLCRRGNEEAFEAFVWMLFRCSDYSHSSSSAVRLTKATDLMLRYVCESGSGAMVEMLVKSLSSESRNLIWETGYLENPGLNAVQVYTQVAREHGNEEVESWLMDFQAKLAESKMEKEEYRDVSMQERLAWEQEEGFNQMMELPSKAIKDGDLQEFKSLFPEIAVTTKFFERCAELCCLHSRLDFLEFLESQGLQLDHPRICVLHRAAFHGRLQMIRYVLERGVPVDVPASHFGINNTALMCAAQGNKLQAMELLLQNGSSPNSVDGQGWRAMDDALLDRNWDMVRLLIGWGFDTSAKNRDNVRYMALIANRDEANFNVLQ